MLSPDARQRIQPNLEWLYVASVWVIRIITVFVVATDIMFILAATWAVYNMWGACFVVPSAIIIIVAIVGSTYRQAEALRKANEQVDELQRENARLTSEDEYICEQLRKANEALAEIARLPVKAGVMMRDIARSALKTFPCVS